MERKTAQRKGKSGAKCLNSGTKSTTKTVRLHAHREEKNNENGYLVFLVNKIKLLRKILRSGLYWNLPFEFGPMRIV